MITITQEDDELIMQSPYDPGIVAAAKNIYGRRWDGARKVWRFPLDKLVYVRSEFPDARYILFDDAVAVPDAQDGAEPWDMTPIPLTHTEPWSHQVAAFNFVARRQSALLRVAMGGGKSKIAIDTLLNSNAKTFLILCPLAVVNVWPDQLRRHAPEDASIWCAPLDDATVERKAGTAAMLFKNWERRGWPGRFGLIVNYDAAWRNGLGAWLLAQKWDLVIADESQRTKAIPHYKRDDKTGEIVPTRGKLAAWMADLGRQPARKLALSGTPGQSPLDLFSQFRFLDHEIFGDSWYRFRDRYAQMGGFEDKEVIGLQNQAEFRRKYFEIGFNVTEDQLVDVPEVEHFVREFDLNTNARRIYDEVREELRAELEDGTLTPANGAVAFLRLQQVTSGIAKADDGHIEQVDAGKLELLADLLDDLDPTEKVVVFCQFREDLRRVAEVATNAGRKYGEISGDRKDGLDGAGQYNEQCDLLGVQLQAGGVGVDLTRSHYCVYFSPGMSLINYEQSLKREARPGQKNRVVYFHLNARNTIDSKLYTALEQKRDLIETMIGDLKA